MASARRTLLKQGIKARSQAEIRGRIQRGVIAGSESRHRAGARVEAQVEAQEGQKGK